MKSAAIEGHVSRGYESVRTTFKALWDDIEVGAALAVFRNSELVVNIYGGFTDRDCSKPWQPDTLTNIYSTSKGITAMALACLVEDGLLDYDAPVVDYWPEFGAENKFDITISQALSHQAGLYTFNPPITATELYDWQTATFNIASQRPAWYPGTEFGYHAITWGYIAGELICRIAGETAGSYIGKRITSSLNADVHLGLDDAQQIRCSEIIGPNHARVIRKPNLKDEVNRGPTAKKRLPNYDPMLAPYRDICSTEWRQSEIPASNIHATAMGLAECYRAFLDGSLVSAATMQMATEELTRDETDLCLGRKVRRSRGFILNCMDCYCGPESAAFGHSGTGGSIAFADPANGIAFAYVMNQLDSNSRARSEKLVNSLYKCL